ncbi:hypothetical protein C8N24_0856 [Solirubrobacter pauli]|uniref:Uncharacterized protein n=1 Tax=Solirubrobacter pauli TaxID=166793 RepID=A0A660LAV6_9ACTN|nr:hypothetical protein [Solirubrobacter pauli]RKQ91040.1 hypothetical protein C8N24_0856 [Solirubrobacter pauli]
MSKLVSAIKRTFADAAAPTVHFHQGTTNSFPEVCHEGACERPRLSVRG